MSRKSAWADYNKYGAKKASCLYGHTHDSKKEADRCNELHILLKCGFIKDLRTQVKYTLIPAKKYGHGMKNERAVTYVADFVYTAKSTGVTIVEDTKGYKTKDYIIKRKMFKDKYCSERLVFREI